MRSADVHAAAPDLIDGRLPEPMRPAVPYLKPAYSVGTEVIARASLFASKARGGYLPSGSVQTLEEAAAMSGDAAGPFAEPEEQPRTPSRIPPGHPTFGAEAKEVIRRVALAELPQGRVLGQHNAVITGTGQLVREVSFYFGTWRPRQHPLYLHPFPRSPSRCPVASASRRSRAERELLPLRL